MITKYKIQNNMKKTIFFTIVIIVVIMIQACSTSKAVVARNIDLSQYSYVILANESSGDRELDDVIMSIQNEICDTKLTVISAEEGLNKISQGNFVLTPQIHVTSEKWDGGSTYITITFYDYNTNQNLAVIKSSGIGLSVSHDQTIAINAISKKLKEIFGSK